MIGTPLFKVIMVRALTLSLSLSLRSIFVHKSKEPSSFPEAVNQKLIRRSMKIVSEISLVRRSKKKKKINFFCWRESGKKKKKTLKIQGWSCLFMRRGHSLYGLDPEQGLALKEGRGTL